MAIRKLLVLAVAPLLALGAGCGADAPEALPLPGPTHPTTAVPAAVTTTPAPTVAAPKVPYLVGDTLYAGGKSYPGWWYELTVHGRTAVAVNRQSHKATIVVLRNGTLVERLHGMVYVQRPALSWDGSKLAYIEADSSSAHLVVRDLRTSKDLGRLPVDIRRVRHDEPGLILVDRVDDDGTAHYGDVANGYAWTPSQGRPVKETRREPWSSRTGFPADAFAIELRSDQGWGAWRQGVPGYKTILKGGHAQTLQAQQPGRPGTRVVIQLPKWRNTYARDLTWETRTDVLLLMQTDTGRRAHLIRCNIVTKRCETVPTPNFPR